MATVAKPKHKEARALYLEHLDLHPGRTVGNDLDPLEAGIVGDSRHGSGYHISRADNDSGDYSVDESPRDRRGRSDYASAMDIGYFKVTTDRGTFDLYDYNRWLVGLCRSGDSDTADLREVIYSLDGTTVRRWDRLGKRSTGDSSHRTHTHLSEFRDADGRRMVALARRWLQLIGLIDTEDDDMTDDDRKKLNAIYSAVFLGGPSCGFETDPGNGRGSANSLVNKADELLNRTAAPRPVAVDASAVAVALAGNTTFIGALAKAVNDDAAKRMQS
ncbi:hypothetical protein ACQEVC_45450 [Plantactinospora sp. CA-294935]|uniref:hypothetical protein n=1 Tax=Plantactinospora sp. CA-294935 TaxID=3240012 RepID=UPI003D924F0F